MLHNCAPGPEDVWGSELHEFFNSAIDEATFQICGLIDLPRGKLYKRLEGVENRNCDLLEEK